MNTPEECLRDVVSGLHNELSAATDRRTRADLVAVMDRKREANRAVRRRNFRDQLLSLVRTRSFRFASASVLIAALGVIILFGSSRRTPAGIE